MNFAGYRMYESGNKLLARANVISLLKDMNGKTHHLTMTINKLMTEYYSLLHSSASEYVTETFLDSLNLPRLSEKVREALSSSISKEEILEAIGSLKNGKVPGLGDGFGFGLSSFLKLYKH